MTLGQPGDLGDGIEDAARGLALDGKQVRDMWIGTEEGLDLAEIRRRVLGRLVHNNAAPCDLKDPFRPLSIGPVDEEQNFPHRGHEGGQHRFDREGARSLHRDRHVRLFAVHDLRQAIENSLIDADEGGVARAPIVQHRPLHGRRRRQRPGRQQERITCLRRPVRCSPVAHLGSPVLHCGTFTATRNIEPICTVDDIHRYHLFESSVIQD